MNYKNKVLEIQELTTHFYTPDGTVKAVREVSFQIDKGKSVGLVGESGCGKSATALSIMRLIKEPPGKIVSGRILFMGTDLLNLPLDLMTDIRGNRISMIFQEPMTSLNPVYTIGNQIAEMFEVHQNLTKKQAWSRSVDMLEKVQIPSAAKRAHNYPHQLSGGMRQRAMIAMALACNPTILIADEPTTALDVTIQAQILDLMLQLKEESESAILIITHDLGVIAEIADHIAVMYAGQIVEEGEALTIFETPKHPYTWGLLKSIPKLGQRSKLGRQRLQEIPGSVSNLYELPTGCSFHPRCSKAMVICREKPPELIDLREGHRARCWLNAVD
jgi:peptide/nickel transport system ATP-binding protein/oligopeptide transport system ATP-binding protein